MTDSIPSAAAVLGTAPDLPAGTPGLVSTSTAPAAPTSLVDNKGTRWDPAVHEDPPRLNTGKNQKGTWARLRGFAKKTRTEKPQNVSGSSDPPPVGDPATPPPAASAAPPPVSELNIPEQTPGANGETVDATPAPIQYGAEAYNATAKGITGAFFGLAQMILGPEVEPTQGERSAHVDAWRETFLHYQWAPLSPLIQLGTVLITTIGRWWTLKPIRERVAGWWEKRTKPPKETEAPRQTMPTSYSPAPPPASRMIATNPYA